MTLPSCLSHGNLLKAWPRLPPCSCLPAEHPGASPAPARDVASPSLGPVTVLNTSLLSLVLVSSQGPTDSVTTPHPTPTFLGRDRKAFLKCKSWVPWAQCVLLLPAPLPSSALGLLCSLPRGRRDPETAEKKKGCLTFEFQKPEPLGAH